MTGARELSDLTGWDDHAKVTGRATFTGDWRPPGALHAAFLRCPHGHAVVEAVRVEPALDRPGVVAAAAASDLAAAGAPTAITTRNYFDGPDTIDRPLLVGERARYAGDPVAMVLAETRARAELALDAIEVDYDRLPAVTDPRRAADADRPSIGSAVEDTVDWRVGDPAAVDRAFDDASHAVSVALEMPRLIAAPLEPRAVLAVPGDDPDDGGRLSIVSSTQTPHPDRRRIADALGLPVDRVRVIAPAVGGGFGPKGGRPYPEELLVAWAALDRGRPVAWDATRAEASATDHQGRGVSVDAELALDADAAIRALRVRGVAGVGAYPLRHPSSCVKPDLLTGPYAVPAVDCRVTGVLTNATPLGPYRGAGRPEAIYILERLLDRAARTIGIDPATIRRRNFVPADAFPYTTALGHSYDSGDYAAALEVALDAADYADFEAERAGVAGRYRGIGLASFVENTGSPRPEHGRIEVAPSGTVTAYCGTADQGQDHAAAYTRLVSEALGIPAADVEVAEGDTADLPDGTGTYGSRSIPVGGTVLVECARALIERAREVAARELEASPRDVRYDAGRFHVAGAADRELPLAGVAAATDPGTADAADGLAASRVYESEDSAFAFGTHVAVVDVDPGTGAVDVVRYVAVDDCGTRVVPAHVDAQIHGGVAQGIGQALREAARYADGGALQTASFLEYAVPRAATIPDVTTAATVTPSPRTAHGGKGVGEAGTIAAPPAVVNAVIDALRPLGVEEIDMPLTPETVWRAMEAAGERA